MERRLGELGASLEEDRTYRQQRALETSSRLDASVQLLEQRLGSLESRLDALTGLLGDDFVPVLRAIVCEDAENRRRLWQARSTDAYDRAFSQPEPLVSVVIPTQNRAKLLQARSLPSILGQSYEHLDVIVVGDCAPAEIEVTVAAFADPRVRYYNLPHRLAPPDDPDKRWFTGSVMARNEGFRRARGSWLVSFDDDDWMHPEAISQLLDTARRRSAEVAYGHIRRMAPHEPVALLGTFPPEYGQFGWQGAIRHASLSFFERELVAAHFRTPNDVFMLEAMLRAGVHFAMIEGIVCDYYPAKLWDP